MDSGGPGGKRLLKEMKHYFGDNELIDSFTYFHKIIGRDQDIRKEVENKMSTYLSRIDISDNQKYLLSIPWKIVLTTNYDNVPDVIERSIDGNRELEIIVKSQNTIDIRKDEKLYCFKLFGDYNYKYPYDGFMVLTSEDRRHAMSRLEPFFKLFKELAMTGNVIYLGYSFEDNLVFELLSDLSYSWKEKPWKGYAINPNAPSYEKMSDLEEFNVEWIKGDLELFVQELKKEFGEIPVSYVTEENLLILNNIGFDISRETQLNCRHNITFLNENLCDPFVKNPKYFYEGSDKTFYPFYREWDIERTIIPHLILKRNYSQYSINTKEYAKERLNSTSFTQNMKTVLMGTAGSGKTTVANRIAYNWYKAGGPVIFLNAKSYRFDGKTVKGFIDEVNLKFDRRVKTLGEEEKSLRFLIIADNCTTFLESILNTYDNLTSNGYLIDLLIVDRKSKIMPKFSDYDFDAIFDIPQTLYEEDHKYLIQHFKRINLRISEDLLLRNIKNSEINNSFFALMYSTIRETQKPLKEIIEDEYNFLDISSKYVYSLVALLESLGIKPHISLIIKYAEVEYEWLINNITDGKLTGILFIDNTDYLRTNHLIISEIVDKYEFTSTYKYFNVFFDIINKLTKGNEVEEEFIHDLVIGKLKYTTIDVRVNRDKIIELYLRLIEKIETRPIYHHLAIHYLQSNDYDNGKYYIKKSYDSRHPKFYERDEFLMDTEGRLEILQAKICIENGDEENAWNHLDSAETYFENAIYDIAISPHPVQGLAQTFYYKGVLSEGNAKYNYCLIGLSKLRHLNKNVEQSVRHSYSIERTILSEIKSYIDLNAARNISEVFKNPDGFSYLAEIEIENKEYRKALELVNEGISFSPTLWLLTLKLNILKKLHPKNVEILRDTLELYQRIGEYDLTLSFELAKFHFYHLDYLRSYNEFQELKSRSENYVGRLGFNSENVLFKDNDPIPFKGILVKIPRYSERGIIRCYDILPEIRDIPVRYYNISYQGVKEKDPVSFNIYFNYTGPQAVNVTRR